MTVITIGIPALDKALMGGIPKGSTILISGSPGSGMELFAKQFAGAVSGEHVLYVATNETDKSVQTTMKEFGWNSDIKIINIGARYYAEVLSKDMETSKYKEEGISLQDIERFTEKDSQWGKRPNFITHLTYEISNLTPPYRIVIDSIDFFLEQYSVAEVLSAIRMIKAHTQYADSVALITMLRDVYSKEVQSGIEGIVDCIIGLETRVSQTKYEKFLQIEKLRNHPEKTGIMRFSITEEGISPKSM